MIENAYFFKLSENTFFFLLKQEGVVNGLLFQNGEH